ncbi:MAG: proton-conducting transporter membrane subunit [Eubacteriales bacterium]|nr:proton-conducting transporter membrane subunit [Eubacteriales bacterium]
MELIVLIIGIPLLAAVLLWIIKKDALRNALVTISCTLIAALALIIAVTNFTSGEEYYLVKSMAVNIGLFLLELALALYIVVISLRHRQVLLALLTVAQAALLAWYELSGRHLLTSLSHHFFVDKLNIIMMLIVAVVGGLICIYSLAYMKRYQRRHSETPDRRNVFFSVIFLFFAAMFGIVLCNDLVWMLLFWEITSVCSFWLIGYTRTTEATRNAFTALLYNTIGGICLAVGVVYLSERLHVTELRDIMRYANDPAVVLPALLLAIAGLSKSAQMPFSKWLLGAMVAPTPTSALLHSSTMVKAGVYLILRIAPLLQGNAAGYVVVLVGGLTFLLASLIAITQSDAKKLLAYSTIANLGLIVSCAGIGTYESTWAAIFLILFHAASKSLLFLSVGSVESLLGSRDIEDMHGLIVKLPLMAILLTIGIAGMFLAPFGMLISKWAAMKAFLDSKNMAMLFMLVFGSAATLFYWAKWLGKLVAIRHQSERMKAAPSACEKVALYALAAFTVLNCLLFPLISRYIVEPFLTRMFGAAHTVISLGNQQIMLMLLAMILLLPVGLSFLTRGGKVTSVYMNGANTGDDRHFIGFAGHEQRMYLSNWYMERYFGQKKLLPAGVILSTLLLVGAFIYLAGSMF